MKLNSKPIGSLSVVANLPTELQFVADSREVWAIKESIGAQDRGYSAFFVATQDGDYTEVWGICGLIPYKCKFAMRLR